MKFICDERRRYINVDKIVAFGVDHHGVPYVVAYCGGEDAYIICSNFETKDDAEAFLGLIIDRLLDKNTCIIDINDYVTKREEDGDEV